VDGLEQKHNGKLQIIRLDFLSAAGRTAAKEYGVWLIPAIILLDEGGQVMKRQVGLLNPAEITARLKSL
jgi:hypothetical protein